MGIVLEPLIRGDDAIGLSSVEGVVMLLEGLEELFKDLVFSALPRFDIRVHLSVVSLLDVVKAEGAITVVVKRLEGSKCELSPEGVHRTNDSSDELVVVNDTIFVGIEGFEESLNILRVDLDSKVIASLGKLVRIEGTT